MSVADYVFYIVCILFLVVLVVLRCIWIITYIVTEKPMERRRRLLKKDIQTFRNWSEDKDAMQAYDELIEIGICRHGK